MLHFDLKRSVDDQGEEIIKKKYIKEENPELSWCFWRVSGRKREFPYHLFPGRLKMFVAGAIEVDELTKTKRDDILQRDFCKAAFE